MQATEEEQTDRTSKIVAASSAVQLSKGPGAAASMTGGSSLGPAGLCGCLVTADGLSTEI